MTPGFLGYYWTATGAGSGVGEAGDLYNRWLGFTSDRVGRECLARVAMTRDGWYWVQPYGTGWYALRRIGPYATWEDAARVAVAMWLMDK